MRQQTSNLLQPRNPYFSFSRKVNVLWGNKKIFIWSYWTELVTGKFQRISRYLYNFQFTLFKQKSSQTLLHGPIQRRVSFLGRKPGGSTRAEEKTLRDSACQLHVILIEVGCRGFIGHSVISFLSKIGITGRSLKVASNCLQTAAQYASSWIWSKVRSFQHEGNTRGTTIPVWLRKKRLL